MHFRNAGSSWVGLCPIHNEKSGSFHVKPQGTFHCFGCGAGGDIFTLVQEMEQLSFSGAIQFLAEEVGITLSTDEQDEDFKKKQRLYKICELTSKWYRKNFNELDDSHPAKDNLGARKLLEVAKTDETIGYAPNGGLIDMLKTHKFSVDEIIAVGLAKRSEDGKQVREMFRNRLIWTVNDIKGKAVGFSGRKIYENDNGPKYLNSPATELYNKSKILLGLEVAKKETTKQQLVYVVEGATDIMAFRAVGIDNVVATCGTAFGTEHANILMHLANVGRNSEHFRIIFCFDGDNAGLEAAKKVFAKNKQIQLQSHVIKFDNGDPCDIRLSSGDSGLLDKLDGKEVSIVEFILKEELGKWDLTKAEGQSGFVKASKEILADITDPIQHSNYLRKVSFWTGIPFSDLGRTVKVPSNRTVGEASTKTDLDIYEKVLSSILQYSEDVLPIINSFNIDKTYFGVHEELFHTIVEGLAKESLDYNDSTISRLSHYSLNIDESRKTDILTSLVKNLLRHLYVGDMNALNMRIASITDDGATVSDEDLLSEIISEQDKLKQKYFI